jgi:hypothetical protein
MYDLFKNYSSKQYDINSDRNKTRLTAKFNLNPLF